MTSLTRMEILERSNRRLWTAFLGILTTFSVVMLTGASSNDDKIADVIKSKRFELIGDDGKVYAILGKEKDYYGLVLLGDQGKHLARLHVHGGPGYGSPSLEFLDDKEQLLLRASGSQLFHAEDTFRGMIDMRHSEKIMMSGLDCYGLSISYQPDVPNSYVEIARLKANQKGHSNVTVGAWPPDARSRSIQGASLTSNGEGPKLQLGTRTLSLDEQ